MPPTETTRRLPLKEYLLTPTCGYYLRGGRGELIGDVESILSYERSHQPLVGAETRVKYRVRQGDRLRRSNHHVKSITDNTIITQIPPLINSEIPQNNNLLNERRNLPHFTASTDDSAPN
jgi:hypothetical protein